MKMNIKILCVIGVALALVGCQSKVAFTEYAEKSAGRPAGHYSVKAEGAFAESVLAGLKAKDAKMFSAESDVIAEPITLKIGRMTTDDAGGLVALNNLMALCTLAIWPHIGKEKHDYSISVVSPYGEKKVDLTIYERRWTSLSPICLIPYPASGEWRGEDGQMFGSYESAKLVDAVMDSLASADYTRYSAEETQRRGVAKQVRDAELKRIEEVRQRIEGILAAKHWKDAITACEAELKESHEGSEGGDAKVWTDLKKKAVDAIAEETRQAEQAAKAAEEAKRRAFEAAANKEIADAIANDRKNRLQSAKAKLARTGNMKDGTEKDKLVKQLTVEIKVLEKLLTEKSPIDYGSIK